MRARASRGTALVVEDIEQPKPGPNRGPGAEHRGLRTED